MSWRIICGFIVLFGFTHAQRNEYRHRWAHDDPRDFPWKNPADNLIDIDLETERNNAIDQGWADMEDVSGSGSGAGETDDEDLLGSGSGSGDGMPDFPEIGIDEPPRANAGSDIMVHLPRSSVSLCGNASTDDKGIASYQWVKKTRGLSVDMTGTRLVCTRLSNLEAGEYVFTLIVTDTSGQTDQSDVHVIVKQGSTPKPLSPCQQLRETSKHTYGTFVPRCKEDGNYDSLQCGGHSGTGTCWCADLSGREIPGTASLSPNMPDCEGGKNLPPCVFMLVKQSRTGLLGAFRPQCSLDGFFLSKQCSGSMCYCVDQDTGDKIAGTEVFRPDDPVCDRETQRTTPDKGLRKATLFPPQTQPTTQRPVEEEIQTEVNINLGGAPDPTKKGKQTERPVSNDSGAGKQREPRRELSSAAHIMTQPGILAAIIGGSVVLLLCGILIVMFIVYRMRKKDEGSYALDEPRKTPTYSYQRAPDKEFYA